MNPCVGCNRKGNGQLIPTTYHTLVCVSCGVENPGYAYIPDPMVWNVPLVPVQTYTRLKRFRKYLARASKRQTASSIPSETWEYLINKGPYSTPGQIIRTLKGAGKKLKKKCYDSLPLLCMQLGTFAVPTLTEADNFQAVNAFKKLDQTYNEGEPFVSYLYALEYILVHIGREDMLPYINKIQCCKRRHRYRQRLDKIFKTPVTHSPRRTACSPAASIFDLVSDATCSSRFSAV